MPASTGAIAGAQAAQADAELRVVVDGLDVEGRGELLLGGGEATGPEVRPRQSFPNGALRRLERAGLLERDHGRVRVVVLEEPHALREGGVCVVLA